MARDDEHEASSIAMSETERREEAMRATGLLRGKVVRAIWRHRVHELGIEFEDGTRLFVDAKRDGLELSIT